MIIGFRTHKRGRLIGMHPVGSILCFIVIQHVPLLMFALALNVSDEQLVGRVHKNRTIARKIRNISYSNSMLLTMCFYCLRVLTERVRQRNGDAFVGSPTVINRRRDSELADFCNDDDGGRLFDQPNEWWRAAWLSVSSHHSACLRAFVRETTKII